MTEDPFADHDTQGGGRYNPSPPAPPGTDLLRRECLIFLWHKAGRKPTQRELDREVKTRLDKI